MKYLIKFTKEGHMRYISHLDMVRLFQRSFKRASVEVAYSQGFSPRPKMSICQPLSLGYLSAGEYIEIETKEALEENQLQDALNQVLPHGVYLLKCKQADHIKKSASAMISYAQYTVFATSNDFTDESSLSSILAGYMSQEEIFAEKVQKKSGKITKMNLKELLKEFTFEKLSQNHMAIFQCIICTGSINNLNPELLMRNFFAYANIPADEITMEFLRNDMFYTENDHLIPLGE